MANALFVIILSLALGSLLVWSFKTLPKERWQILASAPLSKEQESGCWKGVNFTYYGLFTANAYALGTAIIFILMGAIGAPRSASFALTATLLAVCIPASKLVAVIVEKKRHTFTVGGASFVGIILAPWVLLLVNTIFSGTTQSPLPVIPALAILSIAYAIGEGMGRLACISFGCCYGKPLSETGPLTRRVFSNCSFTFLGKTKKIAYASGMDGEKVVPIQGITALLYTGTAVFCIFLFLRSAYVSAFILSITVTQAWRSLSECLRADYRGGGKISAYQLMGAAALVYSMAVLWFFRSASPALPDVGAGLQSLWDPGMLIFLQSLWLLTFLYTGRSSVTGSTISFHVHSERI